MDNLKFKYNITIIGVRVLLVAAFYIAVISQVGSLCACFMAKRGHVVNLYEYRDDIRKTEHVRGRSINLAMSERGRAALRSLGLEDSLLREHAVPMRGRMIHSLNGLRTPIPYDTRTNQCIYSVGRRYLNEVLLTAAENYKNVNLHFNHKLVNAHLRKGSVTLIQTEKSNKTLEIQSDLIIGADGAYSTVRRSMMKEPLFDYNQTYIEHGYIELSIKPVKNKFAMEQNYLHIWPRGEFMMIALPNDDKSWTVTLFMPFSKFANLDTADRLVDFFYKYFPDSVPLIGEKSLINDFFNSTPSTLVSIKCSPYHVDGKAIIIGDAAHAMVPFYGQGMNAGFEDCSILDSLMDLYNDDIKRVLPEFSKRRTEDGHAICDLAMYNYIEMRDLVNKKSFRIRKKVDDKLFWLFPDIWVPLYNSVSFSRMGYKTCTLNRQWQNKIIGGVICLGIVFLIFFLVILSQIFDTYLIRDQVSNLL